MKEFHPNTIQQVSKPKIDKILALRRKGNAFSPNQRYWLVKYNKRMEKYYLHQFNVIYSFKYSLDLYSYSNKVQKVYS